MASSTVNECTEFELRPVPVKCIVSGPLSDVEEDADCLSSEAATALARQTSR